jgi:transcriptional regulator with XRE-family HTH domain
MPVEPHRRRTGPNWNEGARLLWEVMRDRKLNQSDVRRLLKGPTGKELSEGAVNRWLYGDRRPSRASTTQIEEALGVPASAWDKPATGRIPSRVVRAEPKGAAA